jgi:hypothetical protein
MIRHEAFEAVDAAIAFKYWPEAPVAALADLVFIGSETPEA